MIKIIAETRVPKENYEAFAALAAPLVAASQKEPGNIFYHKIVQNSMLCKA